MGEWWSYRLEDLLMFSPATYYRLFELHNAAWWPAQPVALALGAVAAWLGWSRQDGGSTPRRQDLADRAVWAALALAWAVAGADYLMQRLASVHWAAPMAGAGFLAQAALLALMALWPVRRGARHAARGGNAHRASGLALWLLALAGWPLLALAAGRPLAQTEWFALMPDPTVVATFGALLLRPGRGPLALWLLPLGWSVVAAATLWTLQAPEAYVLMGAAALATLLRLLPRRT